MSCPEVRMQLMDYAWQRLSAAETGAVDRHLSRCSACRAVLEEERAVGAALAAVPPAAPRRDLWATVRARQMALEPARQPAGAPSRLLAPVFAARAHATRLRVQWGLAAATGLAAVALMLAPPGPRSSTRAPSGAVVLAHTLDTARHVAQQSDDPMGEMSDSALDILSMASMDMGKESPS